MSTPVILVDLMRRIESRREQPPKNSYTAELMAGGSESIGEKIAEEAAEVVTAAAACDGSTARRNDVIHEAADLIYHLFVLLAFYRVSLDEVSGELAARFGTSGLDEKAARPSG